MTRTAAIVGGGIGGLATAIGLSRAGWEVTVFERAESLPGTGTVPAGEPSALLSPVTGRIGVFVRGTDGYVYYAPETAQGAGAWGDWIPAQDPFETYATDPTAFGFLNANGANAAYLVRTAAQTLRLYTVQEPLNGAVGVRRL